MPRSIFQLLTHRLNTLSFVACDLFRLLVLVARSRRALAAENLFLRQQLVLFQKSARRIPTGLMIPPD